MTEALAEQLPQNCLRKKGKKQRRKKKKQRMIIVYDVESNLLLVTAAL